MEVRIDKMIFELIDMRTRFVDIWGKRVLGGGISKYRSFEVGESL